MNPTTYCLNIIVKTWRYGGVGGGLPYVSQISSSRMVVQELEMSCGAACIRQLLLDDGISHPEAFIRRQTDFNDNLGISVESIASTLNKLNQCQLYRGGGVAESAFEALNLTGAWIARVKPPTGSHYIIVDGIDKELVLIRDPWGLYCSRHRRWIDSNISIDRFFRILAQRY